MYSYIIVYQGQSGGGFVTGFKEVKKIKRRGVRESRRIYGFPASPLYQGSGGLSGAI